MAGENLLCSESNRKASPACSTCIIGLAVLPNGPETPTSSKAVRFDARLEHIRHFLQVYKPVHKCSQHLSQRTIIRRSTSDESSRDLLLNGIIPSTSAENPLSRTACESRESFCPATTRSVGSVAVVNLLSKGCRRLFTLDHWKTTFESS